MAHPAPAVLAVGPLIQRPRLGGTWRHPLAALLTPTLWVCLPHRGDNRHPPPRTNVSLYNIEQLVYYSCSGLTISRLRGQPARFKENNRPGPHAAEGTRTRRGAPSR